MTEIHENNYYEYKGELVFVIKIYDGKYAEILTLGGIIKVLIEELK
jgi:hypothetical protein